MMMKKFKFKMCRKDDPTIWNTLIVIVAPDRTSALNKLCQLMQEEPYLRDLIGYSVAMKVEVAL